MNHPFDAIVVGSGFAGCILAERLATQMQKRVVLLERRKHLGGNMYDCLDAHGVLVHLYGPHIFRTNEPRVAEYLSQFTTLRPYEHRVLAEVDGQLIPVPFNLKSMEISFSPDVVESLKMKLREFFGTRESVPVSELRQHQDASIARLGQFIFEKIYLNYTIKQWGERPENLDFEATTRRVPVRFSYDDRYFQHAIQGLPDEGYTRMFEKMLSSPNIELRLGVDGRACLTFDREQRQVLFEGRPFQGPVIYSGAIDELFECKYGALPYRSLRFEFENLACEQHQPVAVVNYPNEHEYTRITEFKHLTGQKHARTTIAREYPLPYDRTVASEPYYPILKKETEELLKHYQKEAALFENLRLVGRLAEYRYYDMNDIILRSMELFEEIRNCE